MKWVHTFQEGLRKIAGVEFSPRSTCSLGSTVYLTVITTGTSLEAGGSGFQGVNFNKNERQVQKVPGKLHCDGQARFFLSTYVAVGHKKAAFINEHV